MAMRGKTKRHTRDGRKASHDADKYCKDFVLMPSLDGSYNIETTTRRKFQDGKRKSDL